MRLCVCVCPSVAWLGLGRGSDRMAARIVVSLGFILKIISARLPLLSETQGTLGVVVLKVMPDIARCGPGDDSSHVVSPGIIASQTTRQWWCEKGERVQPPSHPFLPTAVPKRRVEWLLRSMERTLVSLKDGHDRATSVHCPRPPPPFLSLIQSWISAKLRLK